MSHHKRGRNPRREGQRLSHKSYRQATRRVIDGDRPRPAWDPIYASLPVNDEAPSTGHKYARRKRPKKQRCPVNGTHEWYIEDTVERGSDKVGKQGYWSCQECRNALRDDWWNRNYCPDHLVLRPFTRTIRTSTCIHCWESKRPKVVKTFDDGRGLYLKNLVLKKREVTF